MPAIDLARRIVNALHKRDYRGAGKIEHEINCLDDHEEISKTWQYVGEIGIDKLLRVLAGVTCTEYEDYLVTLRVISAAALTTTTIKRILKAKSILQKIVDVLEDDFISLTHFRKRYTSPKADPFQSAMLQMLQQDPQNDCYQRAVHSALYFLCICIYGSRPNAALWKELFGHFKFDEFLMIEDKFKEGKYEHYNKGWKKNVADMFVVLRHHHSYAPKLSRRMDVFIKKNASVEGGDADVCEVNSAARLVRLLPLPQYVIFCSFAACEERIYNDGGFLYCGKCKLSRYCSMDCQKKHWVSSHKKECLDVERAVDDDHPVARWCYLPGNYICPRHPGDTMFS